MTRTHRYAFPIAFAAALVASAPAFAAPLTVASDDEKVSVIVRYEDAELRTPQGAAAMAFRVRTAARKACGGDNPLVASGVRFMDCQHRAIDRALATLDAPLLADALGRTPSAALATR